MNLIVKEVSFNNQDFVELESEETWVFSNYSITTPNGFLKIDDCSLVENEQFVGVELTICKSTLMLCKYDGYEEDNGFLEIKNVAFVRHPQNVWLWVYLMDEDGETIAVFCGHEKNFDEEFAKYVEELEDVDYSCAHLQADRYKMLDLESGFSHNVYGDTAILMANPIVNNGFGDSYTIHQYEDTEYFYFKDDEQLLDKLNKIGHGDGIWTPNPNDYIDEVCTDEKGIKREVHIHISLFDYDYETEDECLLNNGEYVCLIPEAPYKARQLNDQFYQVGWYEEYSFRGYVESLAEGDDVQGFWNWLFGVPKFDGLKPWNLPNDYYLEYERFLEICSEMDNNI